MAGMGFEGLRSIARVLLNISGRLLRIPGWILIGMARLYQLLLSPLLGRHCRFQPSCSEYFIESVRKHGAVRGAFRGIWRICRCHPWNPGGYDPP
jgi:putative membrane protein insertion efficiency factor